MKINIFRIIASLFILFISTSAFALPLPQDSLLRKGTLKNGLTYYIHPNKHQGKRVDFYLAQKVGSVLEEENQRGLAHFLEHMAFQGTTHFPGKSMVNYLESIGIKYGTNLNAYTGTDETVYYMSDVPLVREGILDSTLLILADWSSGILMNEKEIYNERGVITEEWRTRNNANNRMFEALLPQIYPNSRYGVRSPIGDMEVIKNFKPQELRDYYDRWYRPDLQAVIVIGDVDVDLTEAKIKALFDTIPLPTPLYPRTKFEVPNNKEPIVAIVKDKEAPYSSLIFFLKQEPASLEKKQDQSSLMKSFLIGAALNTMNTRMQEEILKNGTDFLAMYLDFDNYLVSKTKTAYTLSAVAKESKILETATAMGRILKQLQQHGITAAEFDRFKTSFLENIEVSYINRNKQLNNDISKKYIDAFIEGSPTSGISFNRDYYQKILPTIDLEQLNSSIQTILKRVGEENNVFVLMAQDKVGIDLPSQKSLWAAFMQGWNSDTEPYLETLSDEGLIPNLPKPGKIISWKHNRKFNSIECKLSNGMKVIIKNRILEDNLIGLKLVRTEGSANLPAGNEANGQIMSPVINLSKIGAYTQTDLRKLLAGKTASIEVNINNYSTVIEGSSSIKDMKTLFELCYACFTSTNADEQAFNSYMNLLRDIISNQEKLPNTIFGDSLSQAAYPESKLMYPLRSSELHSINYDTILQLYSGLVQNAADYTAIIVGDFLLNDIHPLVCQYLATLPSNGKATNTKPAPLPIRKDSYEQQFSIPMPTPKATVAYIIRIPGKRSAHWAFRFNALADLMRIIYNETIREGESGTYGVGVLSNYDPSGNNNFFSYWFDTNNEVSKHLSQKAIQEFKKVGRDGVSDEMLDKVKMNLLKNHQESFRRKSYWSSNLEQYQLYKQDPHSDYKKWIDKLNSKSIKSLVNEILKYPSVELIMTGTEISK